jgi:lactoylglutathione lyase
VRDLDRSVDYYTGMLGMRELARVESLPEDRDASDPLIGSIKVYLRYGEDPAALGLALIWPGPDGSESKGRTSTYAGLAVSVPDRTRARDRLVGAGYVITDPTPLAGPVTRSFGTDPDGNGFEFGEFSRSTEATEGSLPGFGFFVGDLDRSVDFYTRILGMRESGRIESSSDGKDPTDPLNGMTKVYLRYGDDDKAPMLSLVWSPEATSSAPAEANSSYACLAIAVPGLSRVRDDIDQEGGQVSEVMSARGQSAVRVIAADPDGNTLELVEAE